VTVVMKGDMTPTSMTGCVDVFSSCSPVFDSRVGMSKLWGVLDYLNGYPYRHLEI
jgi:hypothetical protein